MSEQATSQAYVGGRSAAHAAAAAGSGKAVGLLGFFGGGNFGNDGSLEAIVDFRRRAAAGEKLVCICANPGSVERAYGLTSIEVNPDTGSALGRLDRLLLGAPRRIASWVYAFRQVRGLSMLVIPGTGILDDFQAGPLGWPYILFRWCVAARLSGVDVAFVSVGAGPIRHPLSKWFMKTAARVATYRSYRDEISRNFMDSIGVRSGQDPVYPDIAFALPAPEAEGRDPARPLTVGVGVMAYRGWRNGEAEAESIYDTYLTKLADFTVWLLDTGRRVRLLAGDRDDGRAIEDLRGKLAARGRAGDAHLVSEPSACLHDVMEQMADTDVVVATRFHNVVCALKVGRPLISIGYARKNDVLMEDMGLGAFCQHIERLDVGLLKDQLERLIAGRETYGDAIRQRTDTYRRRLDEQFAKLDAMLN